MKNGPDKSEEVLSPMWVRRLGRRAFQFDAFLCHNHGDGSSALLQRLKNLGAKAWHDGDAIIADRRVRQEVQLALNASRYVLVCIAENHRHSEWCRAEYLPALRQAKAHSFERVIVVAQRGETIPEELADCRHFAWDDAQGIANCVRVGNELPFDPETIFERDIPWRADSIPDFRKEAAETIAEIESAPDTSELASNFARICKRFWTEPERYMAMFSADEDDQFVAAIPSIIDSVIAELPEFVRRVAPILRHMAWAAFQSPNTTNRANGLQILLGLAGILQTHRQAQEDVMIYLAREQHEGVLNLASKWIAESELEKKESNRIIQLVALKTPGSFRSDLLKGLAGKFPEFVRARVFSSTSIEGLGLVEQAKLLNLRLAYILNTRQEHGADQAADRAATIIDAEDVCREFNKIIRSAIAEPIHSEQRSAISREVVAFFGELLEGAHALSGWPLTARSFIPISLVVEPLWSVREGGLIPEEIDDFLKRTFAILTDPATAGPAAECYQALKRDLEEGKSFSDATECAIFALDELALSRLVD